MTAIEEIPIIWKKPHNSGNICHAGTLNILLDRFIKRFNPRLQIRHVMIDMEMPKNATGRTNGTFIIKLHLKLQGGKIVISESSGRDIDTVMKDITKEIENQTRSTDRQKHRDSERKQ